jgi:carboxyl-terminal processing protease
VKPGWVLAELEGDDLTARVERLLASSAGEPHAVIGITGRVVRDLIGPVGSTASLVFLDGDDAEVSLELVRGERDVIAHDFGTNLPTFYLHFDSRILERGGKRLGVIHFTNWFLPMQGKIDAAIDAMRDCDGIAIDLRGNGGGAGGMVMSTAGHFFPERTKLGTQTMRSGTVIYNALPRKLSVDGKRVEPYAGRVAILTDELTGSASEIFAGGMQSTGRARVFGETSAGAVLPATTRTLPNGDGLLYAMGDFVTSSGVLLEGVGVIPDVEIPLTRAGLLAESDPVLETALAWLAEGR